MSYNQREAKKNAFSKIDETFPIVETIFQNSMEELEAHIETLRSKLGDESTNHLISKIEESLTKAENLIKNDVTYKFREELVTSCKETLEAEDEKDELKSELEDLESKNESLEENIESLNREISKLETTIRKQESELEDLNESILSLESSYNEELMVT